MRNFYIFSILLLMLVSFNMHAEPTANSQQPYDSCSNSFKTSDVKSIFINSSGVSSPWQPADSCPGAVPPCKIKLQDGSDIPFLSPAPYDKSHFGLSRQCHDGRVGASIEYKAIKDLPENCRISIHKPAQGGKELADCDCTNKGCKDRIDPRDKFKKEDGDRPKKGFHTTPPGLRTNEN